jgi:hypothetical protein
MSGAVPNREETPKQKPYRALGNIGLPKYFLKLHKVYATRAAK